MSDCCNPYQVKGRAVCPACGDACFPVRRQTMLQQVRFPDNQGISENDYAFCSNRDCNTGYFSASETIPKSRLRAFRPGQQAMLCYCFDISESAYRTALANGTAQAMKAFVTRQTKEGLCACASRNPSGRCCLAAFSSVGKST